ncbi:MAG: Eco57I restriction-modification methylase domain-containing protein [Promethearchaeota archaeon]
MLKANIFGDKELGVVVTPPKTVEYIISRLGSINRKKKILDPCVGPGIFIQKLIEFGVNPNQIHTYDINQEYKSKIEKYNVNFKAQDTLLTLYPDSYNEFDFIVGNPPYLNKASTYVRENRDKLKKIYGKIHAHETYAMFIVNSIWRLKNGGTLGFITSDSFLTLNTHARLRKFILKNCKIDEILLAPKDLFSNQNVSTSPVIIILTKCVGKENRAQRQEKIMRIIPRVSNEDEYKKPKTIKKFKQKKYHLLTFNLFFTDVEEEIISLFENSSRLEKYIKGYIGMHTHNNLKYIAAIEGTKLADIFRKRNEKISNTENKYKIVSKESVDSKKWKPYLKRGGADQYYRPMMEALDWDEKSIFIYDIPENVPFEEEGIVISGVSSRLAARYMPKGCYWDSNKAIGFIMKNNSISIEYALGLLNSSLYNYLAKGIINNTNSIQISGIHALPLIEPDLKTKEQVEQLVMKIIEEKRKNLDFNYLSEQKMIDTLIFNYYSKKFNFPDILKEKLNQEFSIYTS